jgi:hypothetical protein
MTDTGDRFVLVFVLINVILLSNPGKLKSNIQSPEFAAQSLPKVIDDMFVFYFIFLLLFT